MKILLIGDIGIIFTYEYLTEIASKFPGCSVDILSFTPRKEVNAEREKELLARGCKIFYQPNYTLLKKNKVLHFFIRAREAIRYHICNQYDIINVHFPGVDSLAVCYWASSKTRVITSLYGSDVLRASQKGLRIISKLLKRSDAITVASSYIKTQISKKFNGQFDYKTELVRYGSNAATYMSNTIAKTSKVKCKEYFNFPTDKITVLCGYNGSRAQRHIQILNELNNLPNTIQNNIFLVCQCSYGLDDNYHKEISIALDASKIEGIIVVDFMQGETLAKFRNSIDVFLNLQPTDVLSATMIEELEAGAIVIKGDWLCYPDLDDRNIYLRSISNMESLAGELENVVTGYQEEQIKAEMNKGVWEILSWEQQYSKWENIILNTGGNI